MKPRYLEFCGVNSFSEPAKIDFTQLLAYGLFGIFGDTGSGKSTVLDCIGFALYGDVARSRSGVISDVINYAKDEAYVIFEFEIYFEGARRVFRIERKLRRKKDGSAEQNVAVYEEREGKYVSVSDGVRESNQLLRRVIGLEQRDFEKCIALPQGEFSQFVKAPRGERLRIVARLFNLEKFGDALVRRANAAHMSLLEELRVLAAKAEPYEDVTAEGIGALAAQIAVEEKHAEETERTLERTRAEVNRLAALAEAKREFDKVSAEMQALEARRESMKRMSDSLERLFAAGEVIARSGEHAASQRAFEGAERELRRLTDVKSSLESRKKALPPFDEEGAEKEISRLGEELLLAEGAKAYREQADLLHRREKACEEELGRKRAALQPFDYDTERRELESDLSRMPDEEFLALLEREGGLSGGEYAAVREDFLYLERRHPVISEDVRPILQKYASLAEKRADLSGIRALFTAREEAKRAAGEALVALEKRRERQEAAQKEIEGLQKTLFDLRAQAAEISPKIEGVPDAAEVRGALSTLRAEKKRHEDALQAIERESAACSVSLAAAEAKRTAALENEKQALMRLTEALARGGFQSAEEAKALSAEFGDAARARETVEKFREDYAAAHRRYRELSAADFGEASSLDAARVALGEAEERRKRCTESLATMRDAYKRDLVRLEKKKEIGAQVRKKTKEAETAERLKSLLKDNKFMEFVAEEYLQTVASNASGRLLTLTDGRYFLRYEGGFSVGDNFNGGQLRGVHTLSGGETFLVSLSLALSLSAEICSRSARPIEFFFLDEGFGTLDGKLVDTVMDSLEKLRNERLCIGIISHVEELKHRIERKLLVRKATQQCGSQIVMEL